MRATLKKPCWNVTWPAPPQAEQVVGCVPGVAPLPSQVVQLESRGIWMCVSVPNAASSRVSSRL